MFLHPLSIRSQVLISFASFFIFFILALTLILQIKARQASIQSSLVKSLETQNAIHTLFEQERDYLSSARTQDRFYSKTSRSEIQPNASLRKEVEASLLSLSHPSYLMNEDLIVYTQNIRQAFQSQRVLFNKIVSMMRYKGFKSYGLIGEMREAIHEVEENSSMIRPAEILSLRRREKDFILREDVQYAQLFQKELQKLIQRVENNSQGSSKELFLLKTYGQKFQEVVDVSLQLGRIHQNGLLQAFRQSLQQIQLELKAFNTLAQKREAALLQNLNHWLIGIIIASLLIAAVLAYYFIHYLSQPIHTLENSITKITERTSSSSLEFQHLNAPLEIRSLAHSFKALLHTIQEQIQLLEEKSNQLESQNKELKKINSELDTFVYRVSHDLRAPLTSLMGLIEIAQEEKDIEQIYAYLKLKAKSVQKLDTFIKDIIDLSRNARQEVQAEELNWHTFSEDIFAQLSHIDTGYPIEKRIKVQGEASFYSDIRRVQVIFTNLISNAIRYSNPYQTKPYVEISIQCNAKYAIIKISDNGLGIAEEHQEKVFEMFYRASIQAKGSGLGLYIVKESLAKIEGNIELYSKPSEGTCFTLTLPNLSPQIQSEDLLKKISLN